MKKLAFLMATLLIGSMMFTGCKKDNDSSNGGTDKSFNVHYALGNTSTTQGVVSTTFEGFKFDVTYTGADGNPVEVKGVTLPWKCDAFKVKSPFKAKIEAKPVYNEADLPDVFVCGAVASIYKEDKEVMKKDDIYKRTKDNFLQTAQNNPENLVVKTECDL